ncbi:MATE family efflux transporter [Paraliomyxa miuraensis]|uniref:MATE family efflux transporter n=1 Tax=Paraliomyxa miuraensis TaxID=376150 RepID=UPI00225B0789|nr:MATE family efflux transporter [Paraliomyxa miuraensis]MCX4247893.1 MATE family efflux transporter [Paraliomyxa miuraensis]
MPLVRRVVRLGVWVVLAMVTQYLVNVADNAMVGRLQGDEATASQAALGVAMPFFWAFGGFFAAVGAGTQAITGRRYAEADYKGAGAVLFNALCIAVIAGLVGTTLGWLACPKGVGYLAEGGGQQEALAIEYAQIRMLGVAGMVVTFAYKAFFDGVGRTYVHLWAAVAMNVFNVVLNYFFIYGNDALGIPKMALAGAGYASVISTYLGLLIIALVAHRKHYRTKYVFYRLHHFDPGVMWRIVKLMVPSGAATVVLMAGFALFMRFVGVIDTEAGTGNVYGAATKAIMDIAGVCFMPLIAFGTATATCVSQSLGAGKPNLAARYGWEASRVGVLAMIVIGLLFLAIPEPIIAVVSPNDPSVAAAGANSLRIITIGLPLMAIGLVLSQALFGAGANVFVAVAELMLHFGLFVPGAWLLGPTLGYGMEGVWAAATLYICALGIVMGAKFLGHGWRKIKL